MPSVTTPIHSEVTKPFCSKNNALSLKAGRAVKMLEHYPRNLHASILMKDM